MYFRHSLFEIVNVPVKELHNPSFTVMLDHPDCVNKEQLLSWETIRGIPQELFIGKVNKCGMIRLANVDDTINSENSIILLLSEYTKSVGRL